jgi:hypothetical protein
MAHGPEDSVLSPSSDAFLTPTYPYPHSVPVLFANKHQFSKVPYMFSVAHRWKHTKEKDVRVLNWILAPGQRCVQLKSLQHAREKWHIGRTVSAGIIFSAGDTFMIIPKEEMNSILESIPILSIRTEALESGGFLS